MVVHSSASGVALAVREARELVPLPVEPRHPPDGLLTKRAEPWRYIRYDVSGFIAVSRYSTRYSRNLLYRDSSVCTCEEKCIGCICCIEYHVRKAIHHICCIDSIYGQRYSRYLLYRYPHVWTGSCCIESDTAAMQRYSDKRRYIISDVSPGLSVCGELP